MRRDEARPIQASKARCRRTPGRPRPRGAGSAPAPAPAPPRQQGLRDDQDLGPAVLQEVQVVGRPQQCVHRHRDRPDLDGAPERGEELGRVQEQGEDALLGLHPEVAQGVAGAVDQRLQLAIGEGALLVEERDRARSALLHVPIHEVAGGVEAIGDGCRGRGHGRPPGGGSADQVRGAPRAPLPSAGLAGAARPRPTPGRPPTPPASPRRGRAGRRGDRPHRHGLDLDEQLGLDTGSAGAAIRSPGLGWPRGGAIDRGTSRASVLSRAARTRSRRADR